MVKSLEGDGKAIFTVFIGAIIAVVFLASVADSIFTQSTTFSVTNQTTIPGIATNSSVAILGRELVDGTTPITLNATNSSATTLQALGVFIDTRTINGVRTVALNVNQTGDAFSGVDINVTYEYEPDGYLERGVDRNMVALITIFAALGALVFVIVVFIKNGSLGALIGNSFKRRK